MANWTTIHEELYNNEESLRGHRPPAGPRQAEARTKNVVVWTNDYNGKARVFATTLGHNNETVADERYLDLVTRGLLWSVNKLDEQHLKPAKKVFMDGAAERGPGNAEAPIDPKSLFKPDAQGMVPLDLARGKKATASTTRAATTPANAVDGDDSTRWCASDGAVPQWSRWIWASRRT